MEENKVKNVDYRAIINAFSDNYYELNSVYTGVRNAVSPLNIKNDNVQQIDSKRGDLNITMGDYMETLLETMSKTDIPRILIEEDNANFTRENVDEVIWHDTSEKPAILIGKSIFDNNLEDGLCAYCAHFSNLVGHKIEDYALVPVAQEIGLNSRNIKSLKNRRVKNIKKIDREDVLECLEYANFALGDNIELLDKGINSSNEEERYKYISNVKNVMKECGIGDFSSKNIKKFLNVLKTYDLLDTFKDMKYLGTTGMIYNLEAKETLAREKLKKNPNADLTDFKNEVFYGFFTEPKNGMTIGGKPAIRMVVGFDFNKDINSDNERDKDKKESVGSIQYHLGQTGFNEKILTQNVMEYNDPTLSEYKSTNVPHYVERSKINEHKKNVDRSIFDKLKHYFACAKLTINKINILAKSRNLMLPENTMERESR